jgi:hypothetical protein
MPQTKETGVCVVFRVSSQNFSACLAGRLSQVAPADDMGQTTGNKKESRSITERLSLK